MKLKKYLLVSKTLCMRRRRFKFYYFVFKRVSILNSEAFAELIQNKTLEGKNIELVQKPVNIMVRLASTLFQLLPTLVILAMVILLFKMQGIGGDKKVYNGEEKQV